MVVLEPQHLALSLLVKTDHRVYGKKHVSWAELSPQKGAWEPSPPGLRMCPCLAVGSLRTCLVKVGPPRGGVLRGTRPGEDTEAQGREATTEGDGSRGWTHAAARPEPGGQDNGFCRRTPPSWGAGAWRPRERYTTAARPSVRLSFCRNTDGSGLARVPTLTASRRAGRGVRSDVSVSSGRGLGSGAAVRTSGRDGRSLGSMGLAALVSEQGSETGQPLCPHAGGVCSGRLRVSCPASELERQPACLGRKVDPGRLVS